MRNLYLKPCEGVCKHQKCACGHCKAYHLLGKWECGKLEQTLTQCTCKKLKIPAPKPVLDNIEGKE